jgi:hypothetical protein
MPRPENGDVFLIRDTSAVRRAFFRLSSFVRSGTADAELAREIDAHLQLLEDDCRARGMSAREARDAARVAGFSPRSVRRAEVYVFSRRGCCATNDRV